MGLIDCMYRFDGTALQGTIRLHTSWLTPWYVGCSAHILLHFSSLALSSLSPNTFSLFVLQGCRHDRESTNSDIQPGDFNFGYQYYKSATKSTNRFRTLMAYNCPDGGCERILQFSTPSKSRQGVQFGDAQADNARFISERLHIYANFRQSVLAIQEPTQPQPQAQLTLPVPQASSQTTAAVYSRATERLETVSHPGSLIGAAGNMFEIIAKTDLKVTGFSVTPYAATTCIVEVYKLNQPGSFAGKERDSEAWTLIGRAEIETKENQPNTLPPGIIDPVIVNAATTQAFYVTFQDETNYNRYSRAHTFGEVVAQNDDIQFKVVSGNVHSISKAICSPKRTTN